MKCDVMVVDDDPSIRSVAVRVLKSAGYAASAEADGNACLERLRAGFKGLILMDIVMPHLDGWATLRRMVAEGLGQGSFICMLTGLEDPGAAGEGLEEHVMDYLTKPMEAGDLLEVAARASACLAD